MKAQQKQFELVSQKEKEMVFLDEVTTCIAYHASKRIDEDSLEKKVHECRDKEISTRDIKNYCALLVDNGILNQIITPPYDRFFYELSLTGKQLLKDMKSKHESVAAARAV